MADGGAPSVSCVGQSSVSQGGQIQFSGECSSTQSTMPESENYQSTHEAGKDRDPTTACVQLHPLKSNIIWFLVLQCKILVKSLHWHLLWFSISTKYMCNLYNSIIMLLVLQIFCCKSRIPTARGSPYLLSWRDENKWGNWSAISLCGNKLLYFVWCNARDKFYFSNVLLPCGGLFKWACNKN